MSWCLLIIWIAIVDRSASLTSELPLQALGLSNDSQLLVVRQLSSAASDIGRPSRQPFYRTPSVKMHQDLAALPIFINADRVSKMLRNFANEEMATYFLQSKFDAMTYQVDNGGHSDEVLADAMASKLSNCVSAVGVIKKQILSIFQNSPYDMRAFKQYHECCTIDPQYLKHSPQHDALINGSMSCDVVPKGLSAFSFYPGQNLTNAFLLNIQNETSILKQFFISADGLRTEYPATRMDIRNYTNCELLSLKNRREVFASVVFDTAKQVVIVVQQGLGMSDKQLAVAKCVAKSLLNCLSEIDEVFVFAASDKLLMPANLYCANATTVASVEVKAKMEQFLDSLTTDSAFTNHTLALSTALDVLDNGRSLDRDAKPIVLYISRGLQFQLAENNVRLNDVVTANERSANPAEIVNLVIWDCCQPPTVSKPLAASAAELGRFSYEQLLGLKSSARKSSSSSSVFTANRIKVIVVNASDEECLSVKTLTQLFAMQQQKSAGKSPSSDVKIAAIDNPCTHRSSVLLASSLVQVGNNVVGLVGVEIDLAELVAPIMYYSDGGVTSYAFLLNEDGNVIVHPHYVTLPSVRLLDVPVAAVEKRFPILEWKHSLKTHNSGQVLQLRVPGETNRTDADILYYWKRVQSTPYVIVVASREKLSVERANRPDFSGVITRNLAYHRLDLLLSKDFDLCFHGKMLASCDRVGLYLAPRCFQNPMKRFTSTESKRTAQGFWAFVSDTTRLITNPGLKVNIRREIGALRKISTEWKRLATEGEFQSCVLRRYLATPSGVMLTFPAMLTHQQYDPVQRDWFQRAVQHPSKVVITGPNIDPSGFGHVVSLSHTIYEGKAAAMHHVNDLVVAVLAIDVPVTFLYKMLYKHVTICREQDINCFLFDDRGYIVAYDNMQLQGDVIKRPEGLHITHKEPLIASEILQKSDFVRKVVCMRFSDRTVQRMYVFNTSYEDVIRNNDGCLRYQIAVVRQTNVFLAVVNRSCHRQSAFCPCSVTDRRCLNCFRSEPTECECPCECPLLSSYCPRVDTKTVSSKQLPICNAASKEPLLAMPDMGFFESGAQQVRQCTEVTCSNYKSQISCLGIVGCEWCHVDVDRVTPLQDAYCASVLVCFSGVLGLSPYGSIDQDILNGKFASSTPVGPVAGGIMGVFVLLVAGVYWYRQQVNRIMESRCYRANDSSATRLNNELEEDFHFDDGSSNQPNVNGSVQNNGLLLASFERQNLIAMPRPRSRWRPGSRAESSDPGYSTMTANCDDSEPTTTVDAVSSNVSSAFKRSRPNGGTYTGQINRIRPTNTGDCDELLIGRNVCEETGKCPITDDNKSATSLKDKPSAVSNEFVITAQVHAAASCSNLAMDYEHFCVMVTFAVGALSCHSLPVFVIALVLGTTSFLLYADGVLKERLVQADYPLINLRSLARPSDRQGLWCVMLVPVVQLLDYTTCMQRHHTPVCASDSVCDSIGLLANLAIVDALCWIVACANVCKNADLLCKVAFLGHTVTVASVGYVYGFGALPIVSITLVTFALQWTVRESIMGMCPASFSWGEYTLLTQLLCIGFRATFFHEFHPVLYGCACITLCTCMGVAFVTVNWSAPSRIVVLSTAATTVGIAYHFRTYDGFTFVQEAITYVLPDIRRICLVAFWALNCAATFVYVRFCQSLGHPLTTLHRKFFHVTVTLVAVSGFLFDPVFTMISSWAAMNLLCCAEALRALKVGKVGPAIDAAYGSFLDKQDSGFLILTPIYLMMAIFLPLWMDVPLKPKDLRLRHFSGVISVGVGDALASVFGYKWGRTKLPSSRKTLLGLFANAVGQIVSTMLTICVLCSWDGFCLHAKISEYAVRLLAGPWAAHRSSGSDEIGSRMYWSRSTALLNEVTFPNLARQSDKTQMDRERFGCITLQLRYTLRSFGTHDCWRNKTSPSVVPAIYQSLRQLCALSFDETSCWIKLRHAHVNTVRELHWCSFFPHQFSIITSVCIEHVEMVTTLLLFVLVVCSTLVVSTCFGFILRILLRGTRREDVPKNTTENFTERSSVPFVRVSSQPDSPILANVTETGSSGMVKTEATPLLRMQKDGVTRTGGRPTSTAERDTRSDAPPVGGHSFATSTMRRQSCGIYNIGTIQPELYLRRGSVLTQTSGSDYVVGLIRLRLSYDFGRSDFVVRLVEANVEPADVMRCRVVVSLQDGFEETSSRSVEAVRPIGGANFAFNQPVKFPIPIGELVRRKLHLKLISTEPKNQFLGAVELDLLENDPSADIEHGYNGELELSLKYMISIKRLVVSLLRTKGIVVSKEVLAGERSDVWVKVKVWQDNKVVKKKKTQPVRYSSPLVLNQALSFTLSDAHLETTVLELLVFEGHQWRLASNLLGRVIIGQNAPIASGQLHWNSAILHGHETTMWHPLMSWLQTPHRRYSQ
ncbi:hypothetical protein M513_04066, partial [Trichuris suis]